MARKVQDILIVEYNGPQGSIELTTVEDANITRSKPKNKVKTMNRAKAAIAMQTGTEDVSLTMTIVPELKNTEVDWHKAWKDNEVFTLVVERGLDGVREQMVDCECSDVNDTHNENGDSRQEITVQGLVSRQEPAAA